jgi:hypothetical protein
VASQKSKRSRKRRGADTVPRAVASPRRGQRSEQQAATTRQRELGQRALGTVGERPPSPFGGLPVSEIAIFAGIVALVVWLINGGQVTLIIGIALCALGVIEVTAREHFSGYRSHATLLAGIPAIAVGIGLVLVTGEHSGDAPLLFVAVPVFALLFFPLRKRFAIARQARVVRPAAPVKPPPA